MKNLIFIAVFVVGGFGAFSQIEPKTTMNVELGLPNPTGNVPFKECMQGLVNANAYAQYSFPFHLNLGGGIKYSLFTINEFRVPSPVFGQMHSFGAFGKVGWDKFHNERFATDIGVKIGYSEHFIDTDKNADNGINPVRVNSVNIEPTLGLILSANERNSYRLVVGYGIQGFGFGPERIGLETIEDWNPEDFIKPTQYFIIGFGWTLYLNGKVTD